MTSGASLYPMTKFQVPPRRAEHVTRERCLEQIGVLTGAQHVLIAAPAGSGKSTLAAQLVARAGGRVAWISLEESDDEPGQFWAAIVAGIVQACDGLGADLIPGVIAGGDIDSVLVELVNRLGELLSDPLAVVIDDLHRVTNEDVLRQLRWLLEYAPSRVRIVMCSRVDPDIGIPTLRASGRLQTLFAADLRLDDDEAATFLNHNLGLHLTPDAVHRVVERTDGWAAGIYLAALSLRAGATPAQLLAGFNQGDRAASDYVVDEVLSTLSPERAQFLEQICHLDRFSAELCDAMRGSTRSAALLRELDRANLFVIALDATGTWRRLHHLFAAALRERAAERDPEGLRSRHRVDAARLIGSCYPLYLNLSRHGITVRRWLDRLPAEIVERDPALSMAAAWVAILAGDSVVASRHLAQAANAGPDRILPDGSTVASETALVRGAFPQGDLAAGLRSARESVRLSPRDSGWRVLAVSVVASCEMLVNGSTDDALAHALEATRQGTDETQPVGVMAAWSVIGAIRAERGDHHLADEAVRTAVTGAERSGLDRVPASGYVWSFAAYADVLGDRLERAARLAEISFELWRDVPVEADPSLYAVWARIVLAMVRIAQGQRREARELLSAARERLSHVPNGGRMISIAVDLQRRLGAPSRPTRNGRTELSQRELQLLRALAGPGLLREIAAELFISLNTAKTHVKSIYAKLGVCSRAAAVARGRHDGLIP